MYEAISAFTLGLGLGIIGTTMWLGSKIRELKNKILDKQTIAKLLKETLIENKPKVKYKKPYKKKYGSNSRKKSTRGSKVAEK
jgi:hypothetical protein